MPPRSFGRTIRYRRTKLGISQAKLGELVGRSATTIRAWERDASLPTEEAVVTALAAVLDVDRRSLFEKAGLEMPVDETSPTLEEALASLSAPPMSGSTLADAEPTPTSIAPGPEPSIEMDIADRPAEVTVEPVALPEEPLEDSLSVEDEYPVWEPDRAAASLVSSTSVGSSTVTPAMPAPGFVEPTDPFVIAAATPPLVEPSYMEDTAQRQLYRVRNLATVVLLVGMGIVLLWALSSTFDALGAWWQDFIGTLKL